MNNNETMSPQINELATSLAKAQGEFTAAYRNKDNPFFRSKYSDFESVVDASRPALSKYGLSVLFPPKAILEDGTQYLIGILMHSSGQWIKGESLYKPQKADIQSLSSYNTYLKRMIYCNLTGVVTSDDDDGESAVENHRDVPYKQEPYKTHRIRKEPVEYISQEQLEQLEEELIDNPEIHQQILKGFEIESLSMMPKSKFLVSIKRIQAIKIESSK